MNKLNRVISQVASIESVQVYREDRKGGRPARSYRCARRNLARALCSNIPQLTWRTAVEAANKATEQSLRPKPKEVVAVPVPAEAPKKPARARKPKVVAEAASKVEPKPKAPRKAKAAPVFEDIGARVEPSLKVATKRTPAAPRKRVVKAKAA